MRTGRGWHFPRNVSATPGRKRSRDLALVDRASVDLEGVGRNIRSRALTRRRVSAMLLVLPVSSGAAVSGCSSKAL